jgi:hypothetical protein
VRTQPALFPPQCRRCFTEFTTEVDAAFGECLACNHELATEQLLDWLRREWRGSSPEKRRCVEAWAAYITTRRGKGAR